jgi:DNA polymerase V
LSKNHLYSQRLVGKIFESGSFQPLELPYFMVAVAAGFPSPADDYLEGKLDLNDYLVQHPNATFFTTAAGDSMINAGIHSGDLLIVDCALEPRSGQIVIAAVDGDLTVKRLVKREGKVYLQAANVDYPPILLGEENDCTIWGVAVYVIHKLK